VINRSVRASVCQREGIEMKALLVIILISAGYDNGSRYSTSVDTTLMDTMEECKAVKRHMLDIMEMDSTLSSKVIEKVYCIPR
jgi:hypothetical protein